MIDSFNEIVTALGQIPTVDAFRFLFWGALLLLFYLAVKLGWRILRRLFQITRG